MKLKDLMGRGDKIMLFTLPFLAIGLGLNIWNPGWFQVGGPPAALQALSIIVLIPGIVMWLWSVYLVLAVVPQKKLITSGPFALVKHPLYTAVALLVLPWVGFLFNSWIGAVIGIALYTGRKLYAAEEEQALAKTFGEDWKEYETRVAMPWL